MGHPWPLPAGLSRVVDQPRTASTSIATNTTITASATIHTKGAWTEFVASTPSDAHLLFLHLNGSTVSAADTSVAVDIGIGPAGSEVVVIPDLLAYGLGALAQGPGNGHQLVFPLEIPAGSRLSARAQGSVASRTVKIHAALYGGQQPGGASVFAGVTTYGFDPATSKGVILTASAVANTKPATFTDIVTSTSKPINALQFTAGGNGATALGSENQLFDIAIGAATQEVIVWADIPTTTATTEAIGWGRVPPLWPLDYAIPPGTRLSARLQSTLASQTMDVCVHGLWR